MDFLEIRRKAKERAATGEDQPGDPPAPREPELARSDAETAAASRSARVETLPGAATAPPRGRDAPALQEAEAEVASRRLAAEQQDVEGRSEPPEGELDPRFTTWRPGSGARPTFAELATIAPAVAGRAAAPSTPPSAASVRPASPIVSPSAPAPSAAPARTAGRTADRDRGPAAERWSPSPVANPLDEFFYRDDEELPGLVALPGEGESPEEPGPEDSAIEEYLTFELGTEEYAVAIERVREVLKAPPITEVPRAPAGILGVVTVRGDVVAVFDPRRRLGLPGPMPPEGSGRIVIVDDGEGPCGLLVDAVASVVRLARGSIEPCPQGIGGASGDCLAGIGRERNRLFTVLDLGALLRRSPGGARGGRAAHAGA